MVRIASVAALALVVIGCAQKKTDDASASTATADATTASDASAAAAGKLTVGSDPLFNDQGAVVEGFDEGSAAFAVAPDGPVKVALANVDGKPVSVSDRKATLTYSIPETGKTVQLALQPDADKNYFVATGPELSSVVTPVKYEITGGSRPWTGVLQLPAGGTKALNASAKVEAAAYVVPIVGPHGGRIERFGKDDVELLMDKDSGEVRAWIIVDGKAVDPGDRKFTVFFDDRRLELRADANASFYGHVSADFGVHLNAVHKISGELMVGSDVNVVLFGFRPHVYVYAPRLVVDVEVDGWTREKRAVWIIHPEDDDDWHGDHDHHDNGRHEGWGHHGDDDHWHGGGGHGRGHGRH